jgi:carnitine O-acetyltransferase
MFNGCRVPAKDIDHPVKYSPKDNKHIVVIRKISSLRSCTRLGKRLNTSELEQQFRRIYQTAEKSPAVGILTTENRDVWASTQNPH